MGAVIQVGNSLTTMKYSFAVQPPTNKIISAYLYVMEGMHQITAGCNLKLKDQAFKYFKNGFKINLLNGIRSHVQSGRRSKMGTRIPPLVFC